MNNGHDVNSWFCVRTEIHSEVRAKMALDARGYTTFLPMEKVRSHHRGRGLIYRPAIGRYLFVGKSDQWYAIKSTWGVQGLVCKIGVEGERIPAVISDDAMEEFRRWHHAGLFDQTRRGNLRLGELAKIIRGPYSEQIIKIAQFKGADRAVIMLKMFGGDRVGEIALRDLEPYLP